MSDSVKASSKHSFDKTLALVAGVETDTAVLKDLVSGLKVSSSVKF